MPTSHYFQCTRTSEFPRAQLREVHGGTMANCRSSLLYTTARVFTANFGHLPRGVRACSGYFCFDSIRTWGSAPRTVTELDETEGLPFPAAAAFWPKNGLSARLTCLFTAFMTTTRFARGVPDDHSAIVERSVSSPPPPPPPPGGEIGSPYTKHDNYPAVDLARFVLGKEKPTTLDGGIICERRSRRKQTPCSSRPPGRAGSEVAPVI